VISVLHAAKGQTATYEKVARVRNSPNRRVRFPVALAKTNFAGYSRSIQRVDSSHSLSSPLSGPLSRKARGDPLTDFGRHSRRTGPVLGETRSLPRLFSGSRDEFGDESCELKEGERETRVGRAARGGGEMRTERARSSVGRVSQGSLAARRDGSLRRPILNSSRSPHGINTLRLPVSPRESSPLQPASRGCPASAAVGLLLLPRRESSFIPRSTHCTRVLAFLPSRSFCSFVREIEYVLLSLSLLFPSSLLTQQQQQRQLLLSRTRSLLAYTRIGEPRFSLERKLFDHPS